MVFINPNDVNVYFYTKDLVLIPIVIGISIQNSSTNRPVYGIDSEEFFHTSMGKLSVTGQLMIHYVSTSYLTIKYFESKGIDPSGFNFSQVLPQTKIGSSVLTLLQKERKLTTASTDIADVLANISPTDREMLSKYFEPEPTRETTLNTSICSIDTSDLMIVVDVKNRQEKVSTEYRGRDESEKNAPKTVYNIFNDIQAIVIKKVQFIESVISISVQDVSPVVEVYNFYGTLV